MNQSFRVLLGSEELIPKGQAGSNRQCTLAANCSQSRRRGVCGSGLKHFHPLCSSSLPDGEQHWHDRQSLQPCLAICGSRPTMQW